MEELKKEVEKEILNKELVLVELDNTMQNILGETNSIFDNDLERDILDGVNGNISYIAKYNEQTNTTDYLNVIFEVTEDNDDELKIKVRILDVEIMENI